ncbi:MAG: DNA-protecting protein DprA [Candidatus Pacebacteria bacterium]|nr:DNA-protecting protein DprA [Candidatus Paceibacterota bacterium]
MGRVISSTVNPYWLALLSCEGVGGRTFFKVKNFLHQQQLSWAEFWVNKFNLWQQVGLNKRQVKSIKNFKKEYTIESYLASLQAQDIWVISYQDSAYPWLLKELEDKPVLLFGRGDRQLLTKLNHHQLPIGVVGTRQITHYGIQATQKITQELVSLNCLIVSGFMYGVDVTAQQQALKSGGYTIGILGFGFEKMFPASHRSIFTQMLEKGAIFLTEYSPKTPGKKGNFVQRNRIIAGLSLGVLVVEAASKSGSLITANYTVDYGREVFAVPGPINNPYSEGTKALLNQGATLVSSGQEIVRQLQAQLSSNYQAKYLSSSKPDEMSQIQRSKPGVQMRLLEFDSPLQKQLHEFLQTTTASSNQLSQRFQQPIGQINTLLGLLEAQGWLKRKGEVWVCVDKF